MSAYRYLINVMKVVQATSYFSPHIGGIENHVLELSRFLVKKGQEVVVLTSNTPQSKKEENIDGIEIYGFTALGIPYAPIVPLLKEKRGIN
jgi:glycosyltransferase involved in cell wall biosynthesis